MKIKDHYTTVIIVCCFLALFVNQGMASTSFSIYQTYIVEIDGVGNAGGSLVVTVRTFIALLSMLVVGAFYRKMSVKLGLLLSSLSTALGFFIFSLIDLNIGNSLVILCVGSVFTGMGYGFGGIVATTTLIGSWFRGHIGGAAGIAGTGSGVASIMIPVIATEIIEYTSLANAFFAESLVGLVLSIIIFLLVRDTPESMGLLPHESHKRFLLRKGNNACIASGDMPKLDKRLMMTACMLLGAASIVGLGYLSILMATSGIGPLVVAALTSICGFALTIAKIISGWTIDMTGTKVGSAIFYVALVGGLAIGGTITFGGEWSAFLASVLVGVGCSLSTTGLAIWSIELSTKESRLKVVRNLSVSFAFGGFVFNMMPGILKDIFGSYEITYVIVAIMAAVSGILVWIVYSRNRKRCLEQASAIPSALTANGAN